MAAQTVEHRSASLPQPCPCGEVSCQGWLTGGCCQGVCPSWPTLSQQGCSAPPLLQQLELRSPVSCSRQGDANSVGPIRPCHILKHLCSSCTNTHTCVQTATQCSLPLLLTMVLPNAPQPSPQNLIALCRHCISPAELLPGTAASGFIRRRAALLCAASEMSKRGN